jgi:hypothetical protein
MNALLMNTDGQLNTANGFQALLSNTTGSDNTAIGNGALSTNTTGAVNTATGVERSLATRLATTTRLTVLLRS